MSTKELIAAKIESLSEEDLDELYALVKNFAESKNHASSPDVDDERAGWARLAAASLARAYGDDEPEYSLEDVVP